GWAVDAARAALLTMALDFDETAFAGHLGHASALPPIVAGATVGASEEQVLVAQVAAAEVAARVTAAVTLGSARGQTAAHTHSAAAVVGCGMALGLDAQRIANALGLALAQSRKVLLPAFMGSDAKFWVAAGPILEAARCLEAAAAGARGLDSVMETRGGVIDQLAAVPLPEAMSGYGERWHLRTLSIKAIPGCAYLTAPVEAAMELGPMDTADVEAVEVAASIFTIGMEVESAPFISGPSSSLPALGFSLGYNIAAALDSGGLSVDDLCAPALDDAARWELAARVSVSHDEELTVKALAATAPVGAALGWAGQRAREWLGSRGGSPELTDRVLAAVAATAEDSDFTHPAKRIGARLRVRMRDGSVLEAEREAASGCCQEPVAERLALAERKYNENAAADGAEEVRALGLAADYLRMA
ncbi:MAG: MmgE/PrpD family protein, partial [Candidatus Dormibacteraeota bacterium]|nr:MmgE/PrpD family protein [Candidatus Dormibacteraeota bacterium]